MNENDNRVVSLPIVEVEESFEWDPGFEGERWIVVSRFGPFIRVFRKPKKYNKRFFHKILNLPVSEWRIETEVRFLSGLCRMVSSLEIRFQATLRYVEQNLEALPDLSGHIKSTLESLLRDVIERELLQAEQGDWVDLGLENIERSIETVVNETLAAQNIQCRAQCRLEPLFEELSEERIQSMSGHFDQQTAYLQLLRRNHEFESKRDQERFRHTENTERAALDHQRAILDQVRRNESVRKAKEREVTENVLAELKEQEKRQAIRQASEEHRHNERIEHEQLLRKMELDAKRRERQMRLRVTKESDEMLRREIELLVLEKQRNSLEEEIEVVVREWDRKKIAEGSPNVEPDDAQFASIPSPESLDRR